LFKKTKKKLSIIVVLAMVMTMLAGFAAPAAASATITPVRVGSIPTIVEEGDAVLASIRYAETSSTAGTIQPGDVIEVTLPDGMVYQSVYGNIDVDGIAVATTELSDDERTISFTMGARVGGLNDTAVVLIKLLVDIETVGAGDIEAFVTSSNNALGEAEIVVGRFGEGAVTVSLSTTTVPTISKFTTSKQTLGSSRIRLAENVASALKAGPLNYVELTLPSGMVWHADTAVSAGLEKLIDGRKLKVWRTNIAVPDGRTTFTITPVLSVTRLAPMGDIYVTVIGQGTNNDVNADLLLCKVIEYGVEVRRQTNTSARTVTAGRALQTLASLELEELAEGSLVPGGTVTLKLSDGAIWTDDAITVTGLGTGVIKSDGAILEFSVGTFTSPKTFRIPFSQAVSIFPKTTGEVSVTVGGTAGAEGTAVLANVNSVFTAAASAVNSVRFGIDDQSAGDIVITEAAAGRIAPNGTGNIVIQIITNGVEFSKKPTVTVSAGNINIGAATAISAVDGNDKIFTIPVNGRSTQASTITISGIEYDVATGAPNGDIKVHVYGNALVDGDVKDELAAGDQVRVTNARVGAAAKSVFTIGAMTFKQDGQTITMDVAPVIKNGRTLLPLRYAAMAAGVDPDQILWDSVRKSVTLIRGDRVAQVVIGSTTLLINGAAVTMDVAPEIMDGRTMLPMRWIALALRANVDWDATAKTVTVIPY
jgi:hypothetical protein